MDTDMKQYIDDKFEKKRTYIDNKFEEQDKKWAKQLAKLTQQFREDTDRYIGALMEDNNHKFDAMMELLSDAQEVRKSTEATQEQVATNVENITINKSLIKNHEGRIKILEK